MPSHRIHLRGPWDFTWNPADERESNAGPEEGTATMPQDWCSLFGQTKGTAQFRRRFHRPTNLDPHEQVFIVFTEVRGCGRAILNQELLGEFISSGLPVEFEITSRMKSFNELTVRISFDPREAGDQPGGLYGVTALNIRSA